jgi:hypothetical protein
MAQWYCVCVCVCSALSLFFLFVFFIINTLAQLSVTTFGGREEANSFLFVCKNFFNNRQKGPGQNYHKGID